jgi:hypothetical protein
MKVVVAALFLFLSICASAQLSSITPVPETARDTVSGPGFKLTLPPNVEMDINPTNDLAFGINLSETTHGREWDRVPPRFIGFSTQWNSDAGSLDAVVQRMTVDVQNLIPPELVGDGIVRLDSTFPAKLGDLPARRLIIDFKGKKNKPSVRQIIVAYRARPDASAVVYIASLTTTRADFPQDLNLFAKLLAGFKLTPIE